MALDKRFNFKHLKNHERLRIINAIKRLKTHDINDNPSPNGGRYQQYVNWFSSDSQVNYTQKFDYSLSFPVAGILDTDKIVSIQFDSIADSVKPAEDIKPLDILNVQSFLNELFVHELDSAIAALRIGHLSMPNADLIGVFEVNSDGTNITITCNNCPFVLENIIVKIGGSDITIDFIQTPRPLGQNEWSISVLDISRKGPAFLPWNRIFLRLFEKDLQTADINLGGDGKIGLPYWDWSVDNAKSGLLGYLWKDEPFLFGEDGAEGNGNRVENGPFNYNDWILYMSPTDYITRAIGRTVVDGNTNPWVLPTSEDIDELIPKKRRQRKEDLKAYDVYPYNEESSAFSFRNRIEGWYGIYSNDKEVQPTQMCNAIHMWIGGTMANRKYAVNDPIYFLHMANIDRLWYIWQKRKRKPDLQYPLYGPLPGTRLSDELMPWASVSGYSNPIKPEDVLNSKKFPNHLSAILGDGYKYK